MTLLEVRRPSAHRLPALEESHDPQPRSTLRMNEPVQCRIEPLLVNEGQQRYTLLSKALSIEVKF